ncbi:MAG: macro domain-containing protein [Candidatus Sumerlaeia bacterium]
MANEAVAEMEFAEGKKFELVVGNLLDEKVDAIVNAANGQLAHGGGVAAAISRAAGPELDEESRRLVDEEGSVPTGEAVVTGAGRLPHKGVIHAVGPRQGEGDEESKLTAAVCAALTRAHEKGWQSISMPAISSGIFSVPHDVCARGYLAGVEAFYKDHPQSSVRQVRLCLFEGELLELMRDTLAQTS